MKAYLQFGQWGGPYLTMGVQCIEKPLRHHLLGLSYTASGYGSKLPSRYMVRYNGRLYRVYTVCHSNVGTDYVIIGGEKVVVHFDNSGY